MSIKITKGDVLESKVDGKKVIVHCSNDINSFGSGIAGSIGKKWPHVKQTYHDWGNGKIKNTLGPFVLGQIQLVKAEENTYVCNLIGQRDIGGFTIDGVFIPPVRYEALTEGFLRLREKIKKSGNKNISVHSPLLGCGLAMGSLDKIYKIAKNVFGESEIEFTFYAFSDKDWENLQKIHNFY